MGFRNARLKAKKNISDVSAYMEVSAAAIYQWELGIFTPRTSNLKKLATFYGCSVDELLDMNNNAEENESCS